MDAPRAPRRTGIALGLRLLTAALLAGATLAAFAGVLRNGWVLLDDPEYVFKNPHVTSGWTLDGVLWFLHQPQGGNWHPLTSWSHLLTVQLFGLGPAAHHGVDLALHVLNALLLLFALYGLTRAWWRSLFVAGLFALHPLRVESVAWIAERKDVLSTCFFLLALLAYGAWVRRPSLARWSLVVAAFALGLLAKPMVVSLPFVLVLLDVWPLSRLRPAGASAADSSPRARAARGSAARPGSEPSTLQPGAPTRSLAGLLAEKWLLLLLAAASALVTYLVQSGTGSMLRVHFLSPAQRVMNALVSYGRYVGMLLWPVNLAPYYPLDRSLAPAVALAAAAGLAVVTVWVGRGVRSRPYLLMGWLWYLGTLVPVIGLVQVGRQAYADRYTYIPSIGLLVALVWGIEELSRRWRAARVVAISAGLVALVALSLGTARQVALWKDSLTLFAHTAAVTHGDAFTHQCLAVALADAHREDEAIVELRRALALDSTRADARYELGSLLARRRQFAAAEEEFARAERLAPGDAELWLRKGEVAMDEREPREAEMALRRALALRPGYVQALDRLGALLALQGRAQEAVTFLSLGASLAPHDPQLRFHLATALVQLGGHDAEAVFHLRQATRLEPGSVEAWNQLAWLEATSPERSVRDGAEALQASERALELSGRGDADVLDTRAAALAEAGRFDEAAATAREAAELARRAGADSLAQEIATRAERFVRHAAFVDSARGPVVAGPGPEAGH